MVIVAAFLTTVDGKGDEWEEEIKKLVPKVRKDPGTITYAVHRNKDNPSKFFIFERYESEEALKAHMETPHFKAYREAVADMVKEREFGLYREVA